MANSSNSVAARAMVVALPPKPEPSTRDMAVEAIRRPNAAQVAAAIFLAEPLDTEGMVFSCLPRLGTPLFAQPGWAVRVRTDCSKNDYAAHLPECVFATSIRQTKMKWRL